MGGEQSMSIAAMIDGSEIDAINDESRNVGKARSHMMIEEPEDDFQSPFTKRGLFTQQEDDS